MRTNADITIVRINTENEAESYFIPGVYWQQIESFSMSGKAVVSASEVSVYIPQKNFNQSGINTILKGDYVAKGSKDYSGLYGKELKRQLEEDSAVIVQTVNDYLDVGKIRPHLELRCL